MLRIAVFDQSSNKTGYAVFSGTGLTRWGVINLSKEKDVSSRIKDMCLEINTIIDKVKPDIVIFEDVNLRTSPKTLIMLAQIQGCIMMSCFLSGIKFAKYAPATWRRIIGITQNNKTKRANLKEQAMAFVRAGYGINVGDDCAEAICIGLAHLKNENLLPDFENLKRSKKNSKESNDGKENVCKQDGQDNQGK